MHIRNTVGEFCKDESNDETCDALFKFMETNLKWVLDQIRQKPNDVYWRQVKLVLLQFHGLVCGYIGTDSLSSEPDFSRFYETDRRDLLNIL